MTIYFVVMGRLWRSGSRVISTFDVGKRCPETLRLGGFQRRAQPLTLVFRYPVKPFSLGNFQKVV